MRSPSSCDPFVHCCRSTMAPAPAIRSPSAGSAPFALLRQRRVALSWNITYAVVTFMATPCAAMHGPSLRTHLRNCSSATPARSPHPTFPERNSAFGPATGDGLAFPALIIASSNDPCASLGVTTERARLWGAGWVETGALGHINPSGGVGAWTQGRALSRRFAPG